MSDTALNKIQRYGTEAERLAFTPNPASGSQLLYTWYQTDEDTEPIGLYVWTGAAWVLVNPAAPPYHNTRKQSACWSGLLDTPLESEFGGWTTSGGPFDYSSAGGMFRGLNQPTSGTNGTFRIATFNITQARYNPYFKGIIKVDGVNTGRRLFFGLASTNELFATDTPNAIYVGVRFLSGIDTNWTAVACNGVGASTSIADTGVALISSILEVEIWTEDLGVTWNFSINGSVLVQITTNIPTVTTYLGPLWQNRTTSAGDKLIGISRIYLEMEP